MTRARVGSSASTQPNRATEPLSGTAGPDQLIGGDGADVLVGGDGNDGLDGGNGGDVLLGQNGDDFLAGGADGDVLDGGNGDDALFGDDAADIVEGGDGADLLAGGGGQDRLTGGAGADAYRFAGDPFNGAAPVAAAPGAIPGVNLPDTVTDAVVGEDRFEFSGSDFGLQAFSFANGAVGELSGDANVLVLQGEFANAGAAAAAIAGNDALTADAGVFVYHNSTLDINRVVYSSDLGDGGAFSVQANLTSQAGDDGTALLPTYTASDFHLV